VAHLISGDRVIGRFPVPWRGVNQQVPAYELPPDALRSASNVIPRNGVLRPRPGYVQFHSQVFTGTPTGIAPYLRGAADPVPVLGTTSRIYKYDSGAWSDVSGSNPTAATTQPARFTTISIGSSNYVIHTNGKDTPRSWAGSSNFATMTGAPLWSDVCTVADHLIGIIPPYKIQWGDIRSISTFGSLNVKHAAETADAVVALRPLGLSNAAILYKERSIYGVSYTGGQTEATAFRFDPLGFYDGPASPAAVVDVDGAHIYMTRNGRVAYYNGAQHVWIADGVWPVIQADMDSSVAIRAWGAYDPANHEVHFVYPSLTYSSGLRGYLCVTLPRPAEGVTVYGGFPGALSGALSAGGVVRLTDNLDIILTAGTTNNRSYKLTTAATTDDGTVYSGSWTTGLIAAPGTDPFRLDSVETYAERADAYGKLSLTPLNSWTLAGEGSTPDVARDVILSAADEPRTAPTGLNIYGRFFGLRYSFDSASTNTVRFKGAALYALRSSR
jgi:hypothetical protein